MVKIDMIIIASDLLDIHTCVSNWLSLIIDFAALENINLSGPAGILWLGLNSGSKTTNLTGIFFTSKAALGIYSAVWIDWHKYPLICTGVVWDHIDNFFDRWSLGTFLQ